MPLPPCAVRSLNVLVREHRQVAATVVIVREAPLAVQVRDAVPCTPHALIREVRPLVVLVVRASADVRALVVLVRVEALV